MRFGRFWAQTVLALLKLIVGLDGEIRGRDNIPPGGCLIAMKHQSAWDTLILPPLLGDPAVVIKRELQWVPIYGWYATRAGSIFIDRKGGAGALRGMVAAAKRAIAAGRPVVIFPQGTRTAPGLPVDAAPYQPGVAALYRELGVPLVPAAVNSGLYWGRRGVYQAARAHRPRIPRTDPAGLPRREVMAELESRIEAATAALEARSGSARLGEPVLAAGTDDLVERIRAFRRHSVSKFPGAHPVRAEAGAPHDSASADRAWRRMLRVSVFFELEPPLDDFAPPVPDRLVSTAVFELQQMLDDVFAKRLSRAAPRCVPNPRSPPRSARRRGDC